MNRIAIIAAATIAAASLPATAQTVYSGQDNGSAVGGAMPNSTAAAATYTAAASAYGGITTVNFDALPTSDANVLTTAGVTITKTGGMFGNGFSGVSDRNFGNLYGYDQSAGGGGKWYGGPAGSISFAFAAPTNSFGFYTSGTQSSFDTVFTVTIAGVTYNAPINTAGGATFFGFTSATAFSNAVLNRPGGDAWGLDNVSFNAAGVPEPATWLTLLLGMGMVGAGLRRRRGKVSARVAFG